MGKVLKLAKPKTWESILRNFFVKTSWRLETTHSSHLFLCWRLSL